MSLSTLTRSSLLSVVLAAAVLPGCSATDASPDEVTNLDGDAPLSDHDSLYVGWPTNDKLASEGKADAVYPQSFTDLVALQSPVRNQRSRGVCSIFSAVGLMEHLYVKEGTLTAPDFSEQFLQWSVKNETGAFQHTEGSNSYSNLRTIHEHGIVTESDWAYEPLPWGTADDPACEGADRPTRCWTNGEPPASALAARRWHLPRGRWISSRSSSIKAHMVETKEAVVVGGTFFYQSWNHRLSKLPTDNAFWRKGYVTYPNAEDRQKSMEDPAGHSFVLVGWDDDLEVPKRDRDGNYLTDANGNTVVEKGFWLFKNSWGTTSFGIENEHGPGYGWISMQYVEDFLTAYVAGVPEVDVAEVCGNEKDDDFDGAIDCDDSDCSGDAACSGGTSLYTNGDSQSIPDNDASGIVSEIVVPNGGTISSLSVRVDIDHTYKGDLRVELAHGTTRVTLHDRRGGGEDDLKQTFVVSDFHGEDAAGVWQLIVSDRASIDTGTLNGWSLEIGTGGSSNATMYDSDVDVAIPDNNPMGAFSNIEVPDGGDILGLEVRATIEHTYQGDLTLKLVRVGIPGEIILQQADASSGDFGTKTFAVSGYNGQDAAGTWRLVMTDEAKYDVGTLTYWSLTVLR